MTNIIIPMAGAGQRFINSGYKVHKPAIPVIDRYTGNKMPMVVCAVKDLPNINADGSNILFIDRDFHKKDGVEQEILKYYPKSNFITINKLTEGQACTCMLAKNKINNKQPLLIAGCDNGMLINNNLFNELTNKCDVIVFTYRNNQSVLANPNDYGWIEVDKDNNITGLSIKKAISDNPINDHAIVATFWFKYGSIFVESTEKMILENDRINNEFYVDETIKHALDLGYKAKVFEIDRYIGWGTPKDYEDYMSTVNYWYNFVNDNRFLADE